MEGLIVLAVIWFIISAVGKGAKQSGQAAKEAQQKRRAAQPQPAQPARPAPTAQRMRPAAQAVKPRPAPSPMGAGESAMDTQGCVGGSLPHTQHEGMAQAGSLNYQPAVEYDRRRPAPSQEPLVAREQARVTPEQMRAAVVMAEVLNRPVSMRGPRTGGRFIR